MKISLIFLALVLSAFSFSAAQVELDDKTFESYVTSKDKVVFVKFYAPWCGKQISPLFVMIIL